MDKRFNVYLAGLPRGGTTLISQIIGQHSGFEQMGESMYAGLLNPVGIHCSCGRVSCEVSQRIYERAKGDLDILAINRAYGIIDRIREPSKTPHKLTVRAMDEDMICVNDLLYWIRKSCDGLEKLVEIFRLVMGDFSFIDNTKEIMFAEELIHRSGWKIILVTRDPRGMAWSSKKSGLRNSVQREVVSKVPVYLDFAKRAIILLKREKAILHVKYEDLCHKPSDIISKVCSFLEVREEGQMLNFKQRRGHTLTGNRMRFDKNQEIKEDLAWRYNLSSQELDLIESNDELVCLYKELGYEIER